MPVTTTKTAPGKYKVVTPNGIKSHGSTKENAEAQARLLNALDHGFKPKRDKNHKAKAALKGKKRS